MSVGGARESLRRRVLWSARLVRDVPRETRFPFRAPDVVERVQRRRIEATVAHAHEHVPYYRETMRRLGLGPGDLRSADDLARLPLIEREQVQRDPEYFLSRAGPKEEHLALRSGGSTAEPITVFRHPVALFWGAAYRGRIRTPIRRLAGARPGQRLREAQIFLPDDGPGGARREFGRRTLIPPSVRSTRARFSLLRSPGELLEDLNRFRPDVILTFGSYLDALFGHVHATGAELVRPKVVVHSSDALSESGRRMIVERFGVEVLSVYRAIEAPYIGFECERHTGHHLNVDLCPLRIVDTDGRELPTGEAGDVVVSNLYPHGTVLLNYRLGDRAARLSGPCSCGRSLPRLSMVLGRGNEWLSGAEGELVHGQVIRDLMRHRPEVLRYQAVQQEATRLSVAVIVEPGSDREAVAEWVEHRIRARLGPDFVVDVSFPDDLPRTAGGKTRPIVPLASSAAEALSGA